MTGFLAGLRKATAPDHARVDAAFARFDLDHAADYAGFLAAHAAAAGAAEAALDEAGMARLLPDWAGRRRGALLRSDLAALNVVPPPPARFSLAGDAAAWGAAYVLEGSRLGGALLARRVGAGLPTAYLAAPQPKGAWRAFLAALDEAIRSEQDAADATAAAQATFALFEAAAQSQPELSRT